MIIFMKKCKRITFVFLLLLSLLICGSCGAPSTEEEIIRCLNERDAKGIKAMLSKAAASRADLDEQIEDVFDLLGEETILRYSRRGGFEEESVRYGKTTYHSMYMIIESIELSDDVGLDGIVYHTYEAYDEKPDQVGVSGIYLTFYDTRYVIGEE